MPGPISKSGLSSAQTSQETWRVTSDVASIKMCDCKSSGSRLCVYVPVCIFVHKCAICEGPCACVCLEVCTSV